MEDPISFDVYGKIDSEHREEAVSELLKTNIYPSEIEVRKSVNSACHDGKYTILSRGLGWGKSHKFIEACNWAKELTLCQEMYYPGGKESYCKEHNLHYGGILGCHVCVNFYKE